MTDDEYLALWAAFRGREGSPSPPAAPLASLAKALAAEAVAMILPRLLADISLPAHAGGRIAKKRD